MAGWADAVHPPAFDTRATAVIAPCWTARPLRDGPFGLRIEFEAQMFARVVESDQGATDAAATLLSHDGEARTLEMHRLHLTESLESAG
ncbi:hypothetical protein SAMN04515620_11643 [Collimonas sp. OK607]|nr:hypothetical protein SAMN04515620_11643 [Collimonas sp. OK607]